MFNKKMQYVIKSVPTDDKQALEDLLNEMSDAGWDLYTMHEVETETSYDFNCIFMREKQEEDTTDLDDIVNITSFKYRMEKMLAAPSSPYASCKEIQEILDVISMEENDNLLAETVKVRQELTENLGYVIPHIHFHNSDELMQNEFNIKIHDIEVFRSVVFPEFLAFYKDDLKGYKLTDDDYQLIDEITGKKLVWIQKDKVKDFWIKGMSPAEYIGEAIKYIAVREVSDIMDYNDINKYVEKVIETNSFLVDNIIPDFITASDLKYLLTCLIRERVSVKNIVYIFEKINDYANEPTKEDLLDKVRLALSKHIVKDLAENNELKVIEFSDETLDKIYSFFKEDEDEAIVRIEADQVQEIVDKIAKFAKAKKITNPILVVPMDIRHMVFVILAEFVRNITVLAHEELVSDYNIKFVGKI